MIAKGEGCLFRWSLGLQDTVSLSDFESDRFTDMIWLAKLSILSFQHFFPSASFVLLYNGPDFSTFDHVFWKTEPNLELPLLMIDQRDPHMERNKFKNPYHFSPRGVWWKWVPFRFDISKHEIAVDTDIVCLSRPETWYDWLNGDEEIIIAPERYETVIVNTCGDFWQHPILTGKKPFNCGVVGQRAGVDFAKRFYEITEEVNLGASHNSMFITEQGAINLWVRSLELEGVKHYVLDFKKNAWIRDFLYFAEKGVDIETVHAVTWHKKIVSSLKEIFERKVTDDLYSQTEFVSDLLKQSSSFGDLAHYVIRRQITPGSALEREILLG
jgi:hypothetical protein